MALNEPASLWPFGAVRAPLTPCQTEPPMAPMANAPPKSSIIRQGLLQGEQAPSALFEYIENNNTELHGGSNEDIKSATEGMLAARKFITEYGARRRKTESW